MPLKFGPEVTTYVTCARVRLTVADRRGRRAVGWGETPLSVQWAWPGDLPYQIRHEAMKAYCGWLAGQWADFTAFGHALEVGHDFQQQILHPSLEAKTPPPGVSQHLPLL